MLKMILFAVFAFLSVSLTWPPVSAQDDEQAAADQRKVSVLMRLKNIDVNQKPKLKAVVIRHLGTVSDETEYLAMAERFKLSELNDRLWKIASQSADDNSRARAVGLLMQRSKMEELGRQLLSQAESAKIIHAIGLVDSRESIGILKSLMTAEKISAASRNAAAKGLGRQKIGQQFLLELAQSGNLPAECEFTVANILLSSADDALRGAAAKIMKLPATAGSKPLSPIGQLVKRRGQTENGKKVFQGLGTCANCHLVNGQGKEVGPDLSEIGSKLSRQAMYESILNPSLAVSHNYETFLVETYDGLSYSGILVSQTDEKIVLRTAEAVIKELLKEDLDGMKKSKQSLMPADLQKNFSESDLVDLVEYLMSLTKKRFP